MEKMNLQRFAEPALPENTITPEINYETEAYINTTPEGDAATWASLGALTKNMAQTLNEVLYQGSYYKDKGWGSTEVVGAQMTLTLTGDCKPGDPAYVYLTKDEVMYGFGDARKTHLKLQRGKDIVVWPVTLANITKAYGDSAATNALTVTIHGNGKPVTGTAVAEV